MSNQNNSPADQTDVEAHERAFVPPEDAGMLGNDEILNEQVHTNEEQAKATEARVGDSWKRWLFRIGGVFAGIFIGYWFGIRQAGMTPIADALGAFLFGGVV